LAPRLDDSEATIARRLDSFDAKTKPVGDKLQGLGLLETVDASASPYRVNKQVLEAIERRVCPPGVGSWWASAGIPAAAGASGSGSHSKAKKGAKPAVELSSKWHNHVDAQDDRTLLRIAGGVAALCPSAQQKVYPISHLVLGPQCQAREFESVYHRLPNFHPIAGASDEAFTTGKMGEAGMDYAMVKATLEVCARHPRSGVMTEVEEDLWECEVGGRSGGRVVVTRDDGDSTSSLDWALLGEGSKGSLITPVPAYELHHAVDFAFEGSEHHRSAPPLDLAVLAARAHAECGIVAGGWFVFEKADRWAFRSNEFSNASYAACLARLQDQVPRLRALVEDMLEQRGGPRGGARFFDSAASLEKVHAIWRF
jgi:hypothetical protein